MKVLAICLAVLGLFSKNARAESNMWEQRVVQAMTPYALQLGLKGINISKTYEYPENFASVEVRNQYIEISVGSEVRTAHPDLNDDGFTYVLCHEMGHVFAGPPLYKDSDHLSTEGQADYWAAAVCLKKVFRAYPIWENANTDPFFKKNCDSEHAVLAEQKLCYRIAEAGLNFMNQMHLTLKKLNQSDTTGFYRAPDMSTKETYFSDGYPTLQCRAETIAAGAFCATSEQRWVSRVSDWSCTTPVAVRPACWFKEAR